MHREPELPPEHRHKREDNYTELGALISTIGAVVLTPLIGAGLLTPPVLIAGLGVMGAGTVAYIIQRGWVKAARAKRDAAKAEYP
jgi:hypothetical protein